MTINVSSIKRVPRLLLVTALSICFGGVTLTIPAMAHDVTVNMTGKVTNNTCTVSVDSLEPSVDIGSFTRNTFSRMGDSSPAQQFTINLEGCGTVNRGVQVAFSGTPDIHLHDDYQITPGEVTGIAVELLDDAKKVIPANSTSKPYIVDTGETTKSLVFYARMVANGEKVTAGTIFSDVTFKTLYP